MNRSSCKQFVNEVLASWNQKTVKNPISNRTIRFNKGTFIDLNKKCQSFTDCRDKNALKNLGNTCYMDSVLFIILAVPNRYIDKYIFNKQFDVYNVSDTCQRRSKKDEVIAVKTMQDKLSKLSYEIRHGSLIRYASSCSDFIRAYSRNCRSRRFSDYSDKNIQRDAVEFLDFIFSVFGFQSNFEMKMIQRVRYKKNPKGVRFIKKTVDVIDSRSNTWFIPNYAIADKETMAVKNLFRFKEISELDADNEISIDGEGMRFFEKTVRLEKYPAFLVVRIERLNPATLDFIETEIIPNLYIKDLKLFGVVIQTGYSSGGQRSTTQIGGGHYTSFFSCNQKWFYYDDLGPSISQVGSYQELVRTDEVLKRSVLFLYSRG